MYDDEALIPSKREPLWRAVLLWHLWPLRYRNAVWSWVEERTRAKEAM